MKKICFEGEEKFLFGINELASQLGIVLSAEGKKIVCTRGGTGITICFGKEISLTYERECDFFRGFSLAVQHAERTEGEINVQCGFRRFGTMLNCSSKVLSVECVKEFIRQSALMGYNYLQLYTEISYEVPNEPYFGYMKGRYSQKELREMTRYGEKLCVELVPCIQTLGHMAELFKWGEYGEVHDIERVMLVDCERTYVLIENMLKSLSECFCTNKINLGMDEAYFMGYGRYHWFIDDKKPDTSRLFIKHLKRVIFLAEKYGFTEPSVWFDNLFGINYKGYINPPVWLFEDFSKEIREAFPKITLIFWNYVMTDKREFSRCAGYIRQLSPKLSFASMAHGYTGFAPENYLTAKLVDTAKEGCRENGIDDIMITWWGSMISPLALLPSFYDYIERCSETAGYDAGDRFSYLFGYSFEDFYKLDLPNLPDGSEGTGMAEGKNPSFYILAEDLLLGLAEQHIPADAEKKYEIYGKELAALARHGGKFSHLFAFESVLCEVLTKKCAFSGKIRKFYKRCDKQKIRTLAEEIPVLKAEYERFHTEYYAYWRTFNKSMGWEVFDLYLGGAIKRLDTVQKTIKDYVDGKLSHIEELEQKKLPFVLGSEGKTVSLPSWLTVATTSL